jgi:hypothetical protein
LYTFDNQDPRTDLINTIGNNAQSIEKVVVIELGESFDNKIIEKGINSNEGISTIK